MSGNEENKEATHKALPLDLARTQITTVRAVEGKAPVLMSTQAIRGMRVLTQGTPPSSNQPSSNTPTIITTNIVPQAVFKSDSSRTQITSILTSTQQATQSTITIQRPAQITLTTTPVVAQNVGTTYHVPRGPAVVANLAAPRSNVASVRAPMVVAAAAAAAQATGQTHFVRPPRTPSPAQGTAWLTNSSNGNQIKGATTVLSSPVRGASVTGKPQVVRTPSVSTIRPGTLLHSAITIAQSNQIHTFKPGQCATGIQTLGSAVTIAQILPSSRTQAVVYSAGGAQFTPNSRITVANTQTRQTTTVRPVAQVTTARLTVPVNVSQSGARLVTPQATVLTSARISSVSSQQSTVTTNKIVTSQPIGRLSVATTNSSQQPQQQQQQQLQQVTNLGQATRTLSFHPLVVANAQPRTIQTTQANKIITQPTPQGTIHFTPIPTGLKTTTPTVATAASRTINVPTSIMSQRQSSQAITVYSQDNQPQQNSSQPTSVFIHTQVPSVPRRTSPSPSPQHIIQSTNTTAPTTTVTTYSLAGGTYFYDASNYPSSRTIGQQQSVNFTTISTSNQQIRPTLNSQHSGIQSQPPPPMRLNPVMVVDQNRQSGDLETPPTKITSSPRPSILRKRDHDGSPLKAAKNLNPVLASLQQQQQLQQHQTQPPPISPPERPDSRGNGHSSGGSTTISATSSPGLAEVNDDSMPHVPMNNTKDDDNINKPPIEMSPRKKPRKQQLTGNDIDEHNDDMQFISESIKKEQDDSDGNQSDEPRDGAPEARQVTTVRKPASASLLNSYRQTWKATHNHYLRYSDVRPKDERRPTIMDLANQYRVQEKVNGWKIYHLSTQMEDLADQEQTVYNQLNELLKCTESQEKDNFDKDVNRINELIKGNLQRIKIINDGMIEAKTQIMKIFDHKVHVTDIINRCASKRNFKKREKS